MMSYFIVTLSLNKPENRLQTVEKTDWHEDSWTQKQRKIFKKPTLSVVNAGHPDIEYLIYPQNVEVATQTVSLLPA